jgi:hypothetical protein
MTGLSPRRAAEDVSTARGNRFVMSSVTSRGQNRVMDRASRIEVLGVLVREWYCSSRAWKGRVRGRDAPTRSVRFVGDRQGCLPSRRRLSRLGRPSAEPSISCASRIDRAGECAQRKRQRRSTKPGVVGRWRLGDATRIDAPGVQCAGVAGWMFLLFRNTLSGSYSAFTSASR